MGISHIRNTTLERLLPHCESERQRPAVDLENIHIYNNTFIARSLINYHMVSAVAGRIGWMETNTVSACSGTVIENNTFKAINYVADSAYQAAALTFERVTAGTSPISATTYWRVMNTR